MGTVGRRAFLGLGAAGVAGAAVAAVELWSDTGLAGHALGTRTGAARPRMASRKVTEASLPGDPDWAITQLGDEHAIEGYTGLASVAPGEPFPLYVSTTARSFKVSAFRMGWYRGAGARKVWQSGPIRGNQQAAPSLAAGTSTISAGWGPATQLRADDWPPGSYLLRLDAETGAQRYVPITVRSPSTAGTVAIRNCVATWQAYNTWGGYDLYKGPGEDYASRSLAVSLDRPYDLNGAAMFLTYERNIVKLAEHTGVPLSYVTSHDIAGSAALLNGASALISPGHDEYWSPPERAHVTAARDAGMNIAFLGANAMFRRTRLDGQLVVCYKSSYPADPMYRIDNALVTSDWRDAPDPLPESSVTGTIYEGYPVDASYMVTAADSWPFKNTGIHNDTGFAHLVGVEYDRVNPAYPVPRPIQVLAHSPLTCQGAASYADTAYYTHVGGAGVFNTGTMRWVEAIYGDQPHGIGSATAVFVRQVTRNVLHAFADGPAADRYPANDNLDAMHEYAGDPVGSPGNLQ